MQWKVGICPIRLACERLIAQNRGRAEEPLALAIKMRHMSPLPRLLNKPIRADLNDWQSAQVIRNPHHLELIIDALAGKADLSVRSEKLGDMNPLEFACSFRDNELHFLLARKLAKLL